MGFISNLLSDIALIFAKSSSTCCAIVFWDEPDIPDSLL